MMAHVSRMGRASSSYEEGKKKKGGERGEKGERKREKRKKEKEGEDTDSRGKIRTLNICKKICYS